MTLFSRSVFLLSLLAGMGFVSTAHADAPDFKMHVLDPANPPGGPDYIEGLTFQITFAPCQRGELPGDLRAAGCFLGFNRSGADWTSLEFIFQNNMALNAQTPDCSPQGTYDIFSSTNCSFQGQYTLDFDRGVIRDGEHFFITEDGVDPALFGTGDATVTSYTGTVTPEPASFALLATGLLLVGFVATHRTT